jgi:gliding motility-associated-like protein
MAFRIRKLFVALIFVFCTKFLLASPPNLSINPEEFRYTLSITAVLSENCNELKNPNNLLITNINGQMRGYVNSSTVVGNRYMAFLTVYSNVPSGDTIKFQIYNADTDKLLAVKTTLLFQDDAIYGNPSVPQEIHTNNRPTNLSLSKLLIPETYTGNPNLATISAIDIDKDNTLSYALVAGANSTDNASFKVSGNQLQFNGVVNTSAKDTFQIRLRVTDNFGCSSEKEFSLIVDKINDAPTGLYLSDSVFFENTSAPFIGSFTTTDPDLIDKFKYSFTAGIGDADNTRFTIVDSNLFFKSSANFEVKKIYSIRCRVTDSGNLTYDKVFSIHVKDNNDPPTNIVLSNTKVYENEPANQLVAKMSTIDEDTWDKYEYTFANIGTNDNTSFQIVNDSLKAKKVFDFETKDSYVIYLISTDSSGVSFTKSFTITIKDTLDAPTDLKLKGNTVIENFPKGTFIGKLSTVDAKSTVPVSYTFSLVAGEGSTDNGRFYISKDSLYSNEPFDYERNKKFSIRARASLINGMNVEKEFEITVINVSATAIALSNNKVFENEAIDQFVAKISTISTDLQTKYDYSFANIGTNDNASFSISNDTLRANKVFDFEGKNSYNIYLTSTDSSIVSIDKIFTIYIKDALDVPKDILLDNVTVVENLPKMTLVGVLSTVDANIQPVEYAYSLVSGKGSTDNASFLVRNDSLYSNEVFDFEKKNTYNIRTKTTLVNGMSTEKEFVISIVDVLSTGIALSNSKVFENEPVNQFVAKISTVTFDTSDSYKYSFGNIGSNDNVSFAISNDSLFANKVFDFETKNSFVVYLVSTSLSGVSITRPFTIMIKDSLDVPTDISLDNNIIVEGLATNTFIGKLNTIDANRQPVLYSYTLVSGNGSADNASLLVRNDSVFSNEVFDYEKKTTYNIRIRSTLINKMYFEKAFVISIKDIPSTNIALNNNKVYENEPANQFVAKISTVTLDTSDFYTYSLGNVGTNDNISFTIVKDTLKAKKVFDFETKNEYNVYIVSTSLSGISITRPFTIFIKDSLDQPIDLVLASTSMPENAPKNTFIGKMSTIDANTQPVKYTYSFVSGLGSVDSSSFRISNDSLFNKEMFDFEARNSYEIRIRSTLVNGMYVEKTFKMNVLNVNERPVFLSINKDSIPENTTDSIYVATFATIDPDKGDRFVYSLVSGANDAGNKAFTIKSGILLLVKPANYERQSSYKIRVRTTDNGGEFLDSVLTIYIKDVNEQCYIVAHTYEILELAEQQTQLGSIEVKDDDKNQTYLFEIQNPEVPFSINASTGILVLNGRIDYEKKRQYDVWVKITDSGNPALIDSLSIRVNVLDEIEDDILPSADLVSPNGDEKNDTWKITNVALYKDFALDIVDENGQSVYSIPSNYNNDWDAKFRGSPLPSGVYYYVFKSNTNGKLYKGYITVVK